MTEQSEKFDELRLAVHEANKAYHSALARRRAAQTEYEESCHASDEAHAQLQEAEQALLDHIRATASGETECSTT